MTLTRAVEAKINSHYKFYKRLSIILLLLLLLVLSFVFLSYHGTPQDELSGFTPITQTTTLYPSNNTVYVDNNATTNVIVRITGANTNEGDQTGTSLSDSAYFIVNTTNCGSTKPQDANAPLAVEGQTAIGYYDVKVTTNMTLTPDVMVSVTITNPGVTANSIMYYWNTTQAQWLSVSTAFQPLHTVIGNFAALALTGTPIVVGNYISSTPTPTPSPSPGPPRMSNTARP